MKRTILCYGDSNTHGYCKGGTARFDENTRWPCLLEALLGEEYRVCEEGLSGRTTVLDDPLCEGMNGLTTLFPILMSHEPLDLLVLMLGTNDTQERFQMSPIHIGRGMERLVRKAQQSAVWQGAPRILIVSPAPVEEGYLRTEVAEVMGRGCVEKSRRLAGELAATAERTDCAFFDAASVPGLQMQTEDHMHLDAESHRRLAGALAEYIRTHIIWD